MNLKISSSDFNVLRKEIKNVPEFKQRVKSCLAEPTTKLMEIIMGGGIVLDASDIHFEPRKTQAKIRVRIDGILQEVIIFSKQVYQKLLHRIKLLSEIKLNITDQPQDGAFTVLIDELPIEIRVSTLPVRAGEAIVLRILNPKALIEIEKLGLRKDLLETLKKEIKRPNGMIIVTGPTGSGKTTTLYAFLKRIQRPEIKIITIEDPIEYHLKGISQTQVNPKKGYDFGSGLKSLMRQDPDVILVGEIRDLDTAKTALQAALTGHLVLSTVHANDAAGTVARLVSLGAKPSNIGPAINIAIAQRLIRKVCKKCVKIEKPSSKELKKIKKALVRIPKKLVPKVGRELKIPKAKGCKHCNYTGYRGRIGIFETFLIGPEMEKFILSQPSIAALREKAIKKGMVLMQQGGIIRILEGMSTIEEVERITGPIKMGDRAGAGGDSSLGT